MTARHRNSKPQEFSVEGVIKWQQKLDCLELEKVKQLFQGVLTPPSQQVQLKAIKQIVTHLQQLPRSESYYKSVLQVLVEVHSCCASRHPLQRSISSMLQNLPDSDKDTVVEYVAATIRVRLDLTVSGQQEAQLTVNYCTAVNDRVQYVEALLENFAPGETALKHQLPLALEYCISKVTLFSSQSESHCVDVLVVVMKVLMNLMNKLAPVFLAMLGGKEGWVDNSGGSLLCLSWPHGVLGSTQDERREWTELQLSKLSSTCVEILLKAGSIFHEVVVTAAMLCVATFNVSLSLPSPPCSLSTQVQHWLTVLPPFAQLAVCHGLLAKLPAAVLATTIKNDEILLVALFPTICELFHSFTESSERFVASKTLALWTSVVARDCVPVIFQHLLPSGDIIQTILRYVWTLWEDPIDGIRHQCKDMFENVIKIYQQLQIEVSEDLLLSLAQNLLSLDSPTRGKFILLSTLSQHIPVKKLLHAHCQLPSELMAVMGHQALACHAGDLWSRLVTHHWQAASGCELEELEWSKIWVNTLVVSMCTVPPLAKKHITLYCLKSLFQDPAKSMKYINHSIRALPTETVSADSKLITELACLRCARLSGDYTNETVDESCLELFQTAIHHEDEQIRLSALGLMCESHRTTEPPQPSHLKLLLQFVEINANSQAPGFRYPVLTAFKKLLIRIRDSSYTMLKLYQKGRIPNPNSQIESYQEFLKDLMTQQFQQLHPLSSFQRRNFSLSLLQLLASIFEPADQQRPSGAVSEPQGTSSIPPIFEFPLAITELQAKCLVDSLLDPYDANRSISLELLLKLPDSKIGFHRPEVISRCTSDFFRLVGSPKSVSCNSAAFQLRLLLRKNCGEFNSCLNTLVNKDISSTPLDDRPPLCTTITALCQLLHQHMAEAKTDLLSASLNAPMYGVLLSIRCVFEEGSLFLKSSSQSWKHTRDSVAEVVSLCEQVAKLVSPVVCSSSPEGFLPNSTEEDGRRELPLCLQLSSSTSSCGGTAQSLLLCCWHSMKEIALLLGYLVEYAPVISDTQDGGVITHVQLDTIGQVFIHQLTEARHRGAFEMAYTGFSKLCHCLWTSPSPELNSKPSQWVQELLESLQSTSLARLLSITRRSAGLPFYLQAILTAEPPHTGHKCLKNTMQTLLLVARDNSSGLNAGSGVDNQSSTQPAAVHALNILRALYRDSRLGEHIMTFVPEGLEIAIEGFSANLWPVRNSATLLFSALIARIFGAKRVLDEHSMENKVTAKEFFSRFPSLHGYLLKKLRESVELLNSKRDLLQPALFPVVLVLSRLYPSHLDESNSAFSLKPFLPLLVSCTCFPVWKTRVVVARVLTAMLTEHNVEMLLHDLYHKMDQADQNQLHGILLIVEQLLQERSKLLKSSSSQDGVSLCHSLLKLHLHRYHIATRTGGCAVTKCLYLRLLAIMLECFIKEDSSLELDVSAQDQLMKLIDLTGKALLSGRTTSKPDEQVYVESFLAENLSVEQLRFFLLISRHYKQLQISTVNPSLEETEILKCCLGNHYPHIVQTYSLEYLKSNYHRIMSPPVLNAIVPAVVELAQGDHCTDPDSLSQVYLFLTNVLSGESEGVVVQLDYSKVISRAYKICLQKHNRLHLRLALVQFVSTALTAVDTSVSDMYLQGWLSHLEECCVPTQPFEIRVAIATSLPLMWVLLTRPPLSQSALTTHCRLVVCLLQDSDSDVRSQMATSVDKIIPGGTVKSPNAPSALKWYIDSLPSVIVNQDICYSILLALLPPDREPCYSNPLFDEDPLNDYAEDVIVLGHVTRCLEVMLTHLTKTHALTKWHLDSLAEKLPKVEQTDVQSPWDDPYTYMKVAQRTAIERTLHTVVNCLREDLYYAELSKALEHLHLFGCRT